VKEMIQTRQQPQWEDFIVITHTEKKEEKRH